MRIAITGTPATGKTSVARALSEELCFRLVELNALAEEKRLYCGYDRARKVRIVDLERLGREVEKLPGDLVMESHYAHEMPCDLVAVLRCGIAELRRRMEARGWSRGKVEENVQAEIMEVCKLEALASRKKVLEVDASGAPEEAVRKIAAWAREEARL